MPIMPLISGIWEQTGDAISYRVFSFGSYSYPEISCTQGSVVIGIESKIGAGEQQRQIAELRG